MKRILFSALAAVAMISTAALAAEAEGKVKTVDRDQMTITLDDGNSYKLPGEFDVDAIKAGMDVLLAYDEVDGVKLITDMELPQ